MNDLIVIGGGPAGLTATVYALRKRLDVILISKDLGGKTNHRFELPWIEEHQVIRGMETVTKFKNELEYLDFARRLEPVKKVNRTFGGFTVELVEGDELEARTVLIATGTEQQLLGVPGEKEHIGRGLYFSAVSYAPLFIDRRTAVIGESELALRSAAELATAAGQVYLIGPSGETLASAIGLKLRRAENVTILQSYKVEEVLGKKFVDGLAVRSPTGEKSVLEVDGAFVERALIPNSSMVADIVTLDSQGRIRVDSLNHTNVPGLFAAGDVTDTYTEQVLVAVGEGAKAALSAYDYLLAQ